MPRFFYKQDLIDQDAQKLDHSVLKDDRKLDRSVLKDVRKRDHKVQVDLIEVTTDVVEEGVINF